MKKNQSFSAIFFNFCPLRYVFSPLISPHKRKKILVLPLVTLPSEPVAFSFGKHARNLYFVQPKSGAQVKCPPWSLLATSLLVYFCWGKGQISPLEGGTFAKIVCGCACQTSKTWLSLYQFFAQLPTHQYTIFERKSTQFCSSWVLFTIICSKYT